MKLTHIQDDSAWDDFVARAPRSHPFQLSAWGAVKARNGWEHHRFGLLDKDGEIQAGAQMLILRAPLIGYKIAYVPRGPLLLDQKHLTTLLELLGEEAKTVGATLLKIEPSLSDFTPPKPWRVAKQQILHPVTSIIDLDAESSDEILKDLKSGTRRDIRKSQRQGLSIEKLPAGKLDRALEIYNETARRAGFKLYTEDYYKTVHTELADNNVIWLAKDTDGTAVAFLWAAHAGDTAIYLYGGSNDLGRKTYANYLLQWEAISHYHKSGIRYYDLNGHVNDGVSSFKNKFTENKVHYIGSYDLPLKPVSYRIWETTIPKVKPLLHFAKSILKR